MSRGQSVSQRRYRRIAIVGCGQRVQKLYIPFIAAHDSLELVGIVSPEFPRELRERGATKGWALVAPRDAEDFCVDRQVDLAIVASPDSTHQWYVARLARLGCDVLVEKPLAENFRAAESIALEAAQCLGDVYVAHNFRHMNLHATVRDLVISHFPLGVVSGCLDYRLSAEHAASYLSRWHRMESASGGLQVTKACHHVDLLGYLLDSAPSTAILFRGRSQDAWSTAPADADIWDTLAAVICYRNSALVHYSLTPDSPWEGYSASLRGHGSEVRWTYVSHQMGDTHKIELIEDGTRRLISVPRELGAHAGADARMLDVFFFGDRSRFTSVSDGLSALALAYDSPALIRSEEVAGAR